MSWPWSELGLPGPSDPEAVKRAYAQRLKTAHPEEDPEGFQRLHEAYQLARRLARQQSRGAAPPPVETPELPETLEPSEPEEASEPEESFDYERLFAEGDRERQEALERQARERLFAARARREAAGFFDSALDSQEAQSAALTALQALDMLWDAGAPAETWTRFLHSGTFYDAQHNLDFVFGLEDFLLQRPELPEEVRRRIFLAYQFFNGRPQAACMGLYRLLLPSYRGAGTAAVKGRVRREKWQKAAPFLVVLGLLLLAFGLSVKDLFGGFTGLSGDSADTGSADSADTSYVSDSPEAPLWSTLEVPGAHDREGEIDNNVPLEGGHKTSFFGIVVTYAAADYPGLYATSGRGTAENSQETFQWMQITGQDKHMEELVMNYYLSADKKTFYMIPEGREGETVDVIRYKTWGGIGFYKYAG